VIAGGYDSRVSFVGKLLRLARAEVRLVLALARRKVATVHAFLPLAGFLAVVAGKLTRTPQVIVARRALGTHQDRHPRWRAVDRWVARHADVITANAQAVAEDTARREGIPVAKIRVIPNGLDLSPFDPDAERRKSMRTQLALGDNDVAIVCVANLIAYKGHSDLIDAFAIVARNHADARLFLVGDDRGIGQSLHRRAREAGIASRIVHLGHRSDIPAVLNAMDIAVLASHEEGMSNAVIEYLAAGLPVVATNVGGTPEILDALPGCHLVPPSHPESLVTGMLDALAQFEDGTQRNVRRQSAARRFSVAAMVERHLTLYGLR
jgi:glycosyltransferase involved in cell wall biosynthesis